MKGRPSFARTQMRLRRNKLKPITTLREALSAWRYALKGRPAVRLGLKPHSGIMAVFYEPRATDSVLYYGVYGLCE